MRHSSTPTPHCLTHRRRLTCDSSCIFRSSPRPNAPLVVRRSLQSPNGQRPRDGALERAGPGDGFGDMDLWSVGAAPAAGPSRWERPVSLGNRMRSRAPAADPATIAGSRLWAWGLPSGCTAGRCDVSRPRSRPVCHGGPRRAGRDKTSLPPASPPGRPPPALFLCCEYMNRALPLDSQEL